MANNTKRKRTKEVKHRGTQKVYRRKKRDKKILGTQAKVVRRPSVNVRPVSYAEAMNSYQDYDRPNRTLAVIGYQHPKHYGCNHPLLLRMLDEEYPQLTLRYNAFNDERCRSKLLSVGVDILSEQVESCYLMPQRRNPQTNQLLLWDTALTIRMGTVMLNHLLDVGISDFLFVGDQVCKAFGVHTSSAETHFTGSQAVCGELFVEGMNGNDAPIAPGVQAVRVPDLMTEGTAAWWKTPKQIDLCQQLLSDTILHIPNGGLGNGTDTATEDCEGEDGENR